MHLNPTCFYPGTITPGAFGLLLLSPPWLNSMNLPLLCACDIASFFNCEVMPYSILPPLLRAPATGFISSSSLSTWALPLCFPSPPVPLECQGKEVSQGEARPGNHFDLHWSSLRCLHFPRALPLVHPPRTPRSLSLSNSQAPPPPLQLPGSKGWLSPIVHWVFTQDPSPTWLLLQCRLSQSHRTHQLVHQACQRIPTLAHPWEHHPFSREPNRGHIPFQTPSKIRNCRIASPFSTVWSSSFDRDWTTSSFDWRYWTTRLLRSSRSSPLSRGPSTPHQLQLGQQSTLRQSTFRQATQGVGGFPQETETRVRPCTWPWTRSTCPLQKNHSVSTLQQDRACMRPGKWEALGLVAKRKAVTRMQPCRSRWNGGGQLSKRSPGTQRPLSSLHWEGKATSQVYDLCPHVMSDLCTTRIAFCFLFLVCYV
jgi:hypothetical protein